MTCKIGYMLNYERQCVSCSIPNCLQCYFGNSTFNFSIYDQTFNILNPADAISKNYLERCIKCSSENHLLSNDLQICESCSENCESCDLKDDAMLYS